jgi:hypothetical protein
MLTDAVRTSVAPGVKVMTMVQVPLAETFTPLAQVLAPETVKSPAFAPLTVASLENVSVVVPVLVMVRVCALLVTATV